MTFFTKIIFPVAWIGGFGVAALTLFVVGKDEVVGLVAVASGVGRGARGGAQRGRSASCLDSNFFMTVGRGAEVSFWIHR